MHINDVFSRYDEEIIPGSNELYFMDNLDNSDDNANDQLIIDPYKIELYGTKSKKGIIELVPNIIPNLSDDNIVITSIKLHSDYLKDKISRIELELNDQIVYWIDEYTLRMLLQLLDLSDGYLDILKYFMPLLPFYYFKNNDININFTYKPDYINTDECIKREDTIRLFKYRNYDIDYDRDFGYNENAFTYTKYNKYYTHTPVIKINYNQNIMSINNIIPIIQLYRLYSGEDTGRLIIKNTTMIGISTQLIIIAYPNSIDLTTVPFRFIMERGIINNIFLKRLKNTDYIYTLDMPERKCKIKDDFITISYPFKGYISEIYASFTNGISLNERMGRLVYFVHH